MSLPDLGIDIDRVRQSHFLGREVGGLSNDELLAVIGFLNQQIEYTRAISKRTTDFYRDVVTGLIAD